MPGPNLSHGCKVSWLDLALIYRLIWVVEMGDTDLGVIDDPVGLELLDVLHLAHDWSMVWILEHIR